MKPKFIISFFLLILAAILTHNLALSQPLGIEWERTYGGNRSEMAYSVQHTNDGGYIFAGETMSFNADSNDAYLVKTDSIGNQNWYRLFGGIDFDEAYSVQQTPGGGYIIAGWTKSFGIGSSNMYLIRTDSIGDTLWTRTYGGSYVNCARSVQQTYDGGYVIAGYTCPNINELIEMYLVKVNGFGDTLWTRSYLGTDDRAAYSVKQTPDGGYILTGFNPFYGGVQYDIYLIRTDSIGDTLWTRIYGGTDHDRAYEVQPTTDGGYIVGGWTESFGSGPSDIYVIRTDSVGDTLWTRTYGGAVGEVAYSIKQTPDGGYIIAGGTSSFGSQNGDLYLVRIDAQGDTMWTLVYGVSDVGIIASVDLTNDEGYIVAGGLSGENYADAWLVKTGPDTSSTHAPSIEWVSHPKDFVLHPAYPNPFNPVTTISFDMPFQSKVSMNIYNILGERVAVLVNGYAAPGNHQLRWDAGDSPSGIYFVRMETREFQQTAKVVLLK